MRAPIPAFFRHAFLAACAAGLLATGTPAAAEATAAEARETAQRHYELGKHREAFDAYAHLADSGDPEAARIALLMVRHADRLYDGRPAATAAQVKRWRLLLESGPALTATRD